MPLAIGSEGLTPECVAVLHCQFRHRDGHNLPHSVCCEGRSIGDDLRLESLHQVLTSSVLLQQLQRQI